MSFEWSTETQPTPVLRPRRGSILALVIALALVVGVAAELAPRVSVPPHVTRLRLVNPTVYQLNVEVAASSGGPWLDLGAVDRESTKSVEQVLDEGRRWMFRFSYGGTDAGAVSATRGALEAAAWTLHVPDAAGERLQAAGLTPSAR
jgi:hypothetical protein